MPTKRIRVSSKLYSLATLQVYIDVDDPAFLPGFIQAI